MHGAMLMQQRARLVAKPARCLPWEEGESMLQLAIQ